ncbi:MAG: alpha/beta hydrolase [Acidobacteriota bacterium]
MYYDIHGSGEALVLIPGFASGAWSWVWQIEEFAKTFRVIAFDPRGIARSTITDDKSVSISSIADDIVTLLEKVGIAKAHILGISFGGFVALDLALRFPEHVNRLVLASTSFGGPNHVAPSMPVLAAFASTEGLNTADRIRKYLTVAFSPDFVETHGEAVDRFCDLREKNHVPREIYMQQLQAALNFNVEDQLSHIGAETLVITGDNDVVVPTQNSKNLAAAIPHAKLEIISSSGHMAFVERSSEFNRSVIHFLGSKV